MTLVDYFQILWRRKWVIAVAIVVTVVVAIARTAMITPKYAATTTVRVNTPNVGSLDVFRADILYTNRLMNTYAIMATSSPIMAELMAQLQLAKPPSIKVELVPETELLQITVSDEDPQLAQKAADTLASILIVHIQESFTAPAEAATVILGERLHELEQELETERADYERLLQQLPENDERVVAKSRLIAVKEETYFTWLEQYERARSNEAARANPLSIVEPAGLPSSPSGPGRMVFVFLGVMIGAAAGVMLAFLFENLDSTLHTSRQIEAVTELSPLGRIPMASGQGRLYVTNGHVPPVVEAYRSLRANLFLLREKDGLALRTLLVASSEKSEGKSTTIANLAVAIAQVGRRVAVVDADLRQPTQHEIFQVSNIPGLTNLLKAEVELADVLQETAYPNLCLLPSGPLPQDPLELLSSRAMRGLLEQLADQFEITLVDVPALGVFTDGVVLASDVDGVLLLVGRKHVRHEEVKAACSKLSGVNARMVGMTINYAESRENYYETRALSEMLQKLLDQGKERTRDAVKITADFTTKASTNLRTSLKPVGVYLQRFFDWSKEHTIKAATDIHTSLKPAGARFQHLFDLSKEQMIYAAQFAAGFAARTTTHLTTRLQIPRSNGRAARPPDMAESALPVPRETSIATSGKAQSGKKLHNGRNGHSGRKRNKNRQRKR